MIIKVLGTGCPKCKETEANVRAALAELGVEAEVVKVTDVNEIMEYGVFMTPALVIDEKVVVSGKLPSIEEIKGWIQAGV
ncbi:MAG: thioredoxin family protein [Firmicutes bacterium]|nr:thioredoxin family protein [Bacillota bacterium]